MKKKVIAIVGLTLFSTIISCEKENKTSYDTSFTKLNPNSYQYKKELSRIIKLDSTFEINYFFDGYLEQNDSEFIKVLIETPDFKASSLVQVEKWDAELLPIKENKGKSYHGSRLKNLKLKVKETSNTIDFLCNGVEKIID